MAQHDFHFRKALQDPKAVFETPERVLADPRLDREGKRAILRSWEQDERELAVAEEEGMAGGERDMLRKVLRALDAVSGGTAEGAEAITKHGGRTAAGEEDPGETQAAPPVKDLMRPIDEVVHVDHGLDEAFVRMRLLQVPFLPVVDGDEIVGVLSATDIHEGPGGAEGGVTAGKVRDRVSTAVALCYENDDATMAREVMDKSGYHRLLVTDDEDRLVGLITLEAITAALRECGPG